MLDSKSLCTEEQIRKAAKHLFFVEGKLHATTQEIADAAGVNRTLLNYYFRSRDELFRQVYLDTRNEIESVLENLFLEKMEFRAKIEYIIDTFGKYIQDAPYTELFMISEINLLEEPLAFQKLSNPEPMQYFMHEVQIEMDKGTLLSTEPIHFVINLFSMISHPLLLKPLYSRIFDINQLDIETVFASRKQRIMEVLFK